LSNASLLNKSLHRLHHHTFQIAPVKFAALVSQQIEKARLALAVTQFTFGYIYATLQSDSSSPSLQLM
jgi:hypothetical protein